MNTNTVSSWAVLSPTVKAEARALFLAEAQAGIENQQPAETPAPPLTPEGARDGVNRHRTALVEALRNVRSAVASGTALAADRLTEAIGAATQWVTSVEAQIDTATPDAQVELLQQVSRLHPLIQEAEREEHGGAAKTGQPNRR